jgi:hypothetical protein
MATHILQQIRKALNNLNPGDVRRLAERQLTIGLAASSSEALAAIEDFFVPRTVSHRRRQELVSVVHRIGDPGAPSRFDVEIIEEGLPAAPGCFQFSMHDPERVVREVLHEREDLALPLARLLPPFRKPVTQRIVRDVARENAGFSLLTALPDILPSALSLPWVAGEFASDTTVLTVNQVRMAFLLAAASDRKVGYIEQKAQIASIIASAFGWRALARQLMAKIPLGGGLIPKAAVAYAGTYVVGIGLERFYGRGYGLTRAERKLAYRKAFEDGRELARLLLEKARSATKPGRYASN